MDGITLKKSTTTKMNVKKATIADGKMVVDGEVVDLMKIIGDNFENCIFDIAINEKVDEDMDVVGIDVDSVGMSDSDDYDEY